MMTHRERILRVMRGELVDVIPFVPRLDLWWLSNATRGTLPKKYEGMMPDDISRAEGWPLYHMVPNFADISSANDILHRAIGLFNFKQSAYGWRFTERIAVKTEDRDGQQIVEYHTPLGMVRTLGGLTEQAKKTGSSLGWVQEHIIKEPGDYKIVGSLFENIEVFSQYDSCKEYVEKVGEEGVVAVGGPTLAASPVHMIQKDLIDTTKFFYEYRDHYREIMELSEKIEVYFNRVLEILADAPADVVLWGANYDDMLTYRPYFEKEISPWLRKVSSVLGGRGKIVATHTDGENLGLMDAIRDSGVHLAESVTPYPMTKVRIEEYYRRWKGNMTIMGGIPESMLLEKSTSHEEFESFLDSLFSELVPGDRLIFGTADSTPPDASFERLFRIAERVEKEGRLPLKGKAKTGPKAETGIAPAGKAESPSDKKGATTTIDPTMDVFAQIVVRIEEGNSLSVKALVEAALAAKISPADILNKGLVAGLEPVGLKFKNNEIFIPEVLMSARAMKAGLELIKPQLKETNAASRGKVIIGTVKDDLHDIGKNIVAVMFEGAGYEVIDLGINITKERFAEALRQNEDAKILGVSALLTTTMTYMQEVIDEVRTVSGSVKILVGGAPVTQKFANEIKADGYAADAATAVEVAAALIK
jgi:methylmalonyl-CoA mutase cobalamin-binding domain/chain